MSRSLLFSYRPSRREFLRNIAVLGALTMSANFVAACQVPTSPQTGGAAAPAAAVPGQLARNETLYIAGFQWGPPTTFNPLAAGSINWPTGDQRQHLYETLFGYNLLTGALDPVLAKALEFSDDSTAVVTLQDGTHWQDGTPLTTDDVVYTYELAKRHNDLNYSTFWDYATEVKATGDRTIEFKLNTERLNPGMFKNFLGSVYILPKHIWEEHEQAGTSLTQIVDTDPVASGPYKVQATSPERIAMERDDNYWGIPIYGTPAPKYMVHPIFKSNDDGNLALQRGEVDLSQQFVPQIWLMWEDKKLTVGTWYKEEPYYVPGSIPLLFVNTHKKGLDNPKVRRALAHAINYPQIAATAMSRYSVPANASLIIPEGGEKQFFDDAQVKELGWSYDLQKATQILEEELQAKKGSDGIYVLPDGTRLGPYTAQTPYGWTDWMTAIDLVTQSAKAVGIEVRSEFPDAPVVTNHMQNGDFDLALWYVAGVGPASPWLRFRDVLDDRGVLDFGQAAFWNYGRFQHPDVPGLLDQVAVLADPEEQMDLYSQLDKIFIENIPAIPLMYRPLEFYEFNESVWTGFPTADNPVAPPTQGRAGIKMWYVIKPKS